MKIQRIDATRDTAAAFLHPCSSAAASDRVNLDLLRSFFAIVELGSMSKAAERLHVSQSTLTRQMQTLEHEIGGQLLERGYGGVALTAAGHTLLDGMRPVVARAEAVVADARKRARGQSGSLRIGYMMTAAANYLNPALVRLRQEHPEIKVKLVDLSPGELMEGLRKGELDVVVLGYADPSVAREFFMKTIASFPVMVALPGSHPLAENEEIGLAELRHEVFVGAQESDIPGYNRWLVQLCRGAHFRPRFIEDADSLSKTLSILVAENAVALLPELATATGGGGVTFRRLRHASAKWDLQVVWQRGKITEPIKEFVAALSQKAETKMGKKTAGCRAGRAQRPGRRRFRRKATSGADGSSVICAAGAF
jgi:DNA-binding transcriptional LysR family regulator